MVLVFVDTPDENIHRRLLENRASGRRGDVTDEVVADQESFEPPGEDEQHIRLPVEPGSADLDGLCAVLRGSLAQSG